MGFIWYIIIGIIAGFLAGKIMRGGAVGYLPFSDLRLRD